jgi:hypothetical protein
MKKQKVDILMEIEEILLDFYNLAEDDIPYTDIQGIAIAKGKEIYKIIMDNEKMEMV